MVLNTVLRMLTRFLRDDNGPTTVEYAFLLVLILVVALTAIAVFGQATGGSFQDSNDSLAEYMSGGG